MSIEELAEYIGESKRTIYRYIKSGDCPPYIRLTRKNIKFDKKDVDAWLESKKVNPTIENTHLQHYISCVAAQQGATSEGD